MNFKKPLLIQSELGQLFGATSHEVGRWLVDCGLRCPRFKRPTDKAISEKYCGPIEATLSYTNYGWNPQKTVPELVSAGHRLLDEPPASLVDSPALVGPFSISPANPKVVLNANDDFVVKTSSSAHGQIIKRLLDLAHKHGTLEKLASK